MGQRWDKKSGNQINNFLGHRGEIGRINISQVQTLCFYNLFLYRLGLRQPPHKDERGVFGIHFNARIG